MQAITSNTLTRVANFFIKAARNETNPSATAATAAKTYWGGEKLLDKKDRQFLIKCLVTFGIYALHTHFQSKRKEREFSKLAVQIANTKMTLEKQEKSFLRSKSGHKLSLNDGAIVIKDIHLLDFNHETRSMGKGVANNMIRSEINAAKERKNKHIKGIYINVNGVENIVFGVSVEEYQLNCLRYVGMNSKKCREAVFSDHYANPFDSLTTALNKTYQIEKPLNDAIDIYQQFVQKNPTEMFDPRHL